MIFSYVKFKLSDDSPVSDCHSRRYKMIEYASVEDGMYPFKNSNGQIYLDIYDCNKDYKFFKCPVYFFYTANGFQLYAAFLEKVNGSDYFFAHDDLEMITSDCMPFYYTDNGYLIIINQEQTEIEIMCFDDGNGDMPSIYKAYVEGQYDEDLWYLKRHND